MFFPIGDDQVQGGHRPIVTYALLGLNVLAFFLQTMHPEAYICELGSIPDEIRRGIDLHTLFTSMFMHGGWMHLIGNMLFLWVFADNIEAKVGSVPFLGFYLLGGLAASGLHILLSIGEPSLGCCLPCGNIPCLEQSIACNGAIPSVGASGAIAAVLGAYLVMFPKSKIKILVLVIFRAFKVPAYLFLGFWIVQQLFSGFSSMGPEGSSGGVAWWAHIGGFIFGVLVGLLMKRMFMGKNNNPIRRKSPPQIDGLV